MRLRNESKFPGVLLKQNIAGNIGGLSKLAEQRLKQLSELIRKFTRLCEYETETNNAQSLDYKHEGKFS